MTMHEPMQAKIRQAVGAAVVGNVLEWYDFSVYAFVAIYIAKNFFPQADEVTRLLGAFLAFGLGFVARPLGGIVIGRIGDTHGRKLALIITILLMATGTALIGILPSYGSVRAAATRRVVATRVMPGLLG